MNWRTLFHRKARVVAHVRYVKVPAISPRAKAYAMAMERGMTKQAKILEGDTPCHRHPDCDCVVGCAAKMEGAL